MPGRATSAAEVTHVSRHGVWLLLDGEERAEEPLLPFAAFPWFRRATIEQLLDLSVQSVRRVQEHLFVAHAPMGARGVLPTRRSASVVRPRSANSPEALMPERQARVARAAALLLAGTLPLAALPAQSRFGGALAAVASQPLGDFRQNS